MTKLNKEVVEVLHNSNFIACLCTTNLEGNPSGRYVKVVPSNDLSKLYVGDRKLHRAEKYLEQNPQAVFVICDRFDDPLQAKSFQIECSLDDTRIFNEGDPIFKQVSHLTMDELSRPEKTFLSNLINKTKNDHEISTLKKYLILADKLEKNSLKEVLSFTINHIYDVSLQNN